MAVEKATKDDLAEILGWLELESTANDGEGFWCNRGVISNSFAEGSLWVIRRAGRAVAFQVGDYEADIACVRQDAQRQGLGTELFEASLVRAVSAGVNVLSGECAPRSSFPFWQKHGFERFGDLSEFGRILVRRIISYRHDIPEGLPTVDVKIEFHPEDVLHKGGSAADVFVHRPQARRSPDGSILLERRILGLASDMPRGKDMVVKVTVDGEQLCFCKAKYNEARDVGVERDQDGNFYIDVIHPARPEE